MNDTPKVVISNSLTESPWENAVVAGGDLAETVNRLKAHQRLRLVTAHPFDCGITALHFEPERS